MEVQRITQILWLSDFFRPHEADVRKIFALLEKIARRLFSHSRPIRWALPPRLVFTRPLSAAAGIEDAPCKARPPSNPGFGTAAGFGSGRARRAGGGPIAIENAVCLAGARPGYCFARSDAERSGLRRFRREGA